MAKTPVSKFGHKLKLAFEEKKSIGIWLNISYQPLKKYEKAVIVRSTIPDVQNDREAYLT